MTGFLKIASVVAALTAGAFAVPDVTVVPVTGGCSAWPSYDASTGIAGPWVFVVSGSDSPVEGFGPTTQIYRRSGDTEVHMGAFTIVDDNQLAKNPLRCTDTRGFEGLTPSGVSGYSWNTVIVDPIPYDAEMMWGVGGSAVQLYQHYIDGVLQDGFFIGSENVTTWGIKRYDAEDSYDGRAFWLPRLLGPDSALPQNGSATYPDEYTTFLKISS